jgi:dimethylglycine dehydrogenase
MWLDGIPADFAFGTWDGDADRPAPYLRDATARVPLLAGADLRRIVNGPVPYSPDGNPHLGPERGLRNFYHCNTFSLGVTQAGGAGKALAEWVAEGEPEWDLWSLDPRRYSGNPPKAYVLSKAIEAYQGSAHASVSLCGAAGGAAPQDLAALWPAQREGGPLRDSRRLEARGLLRPDARGGGGTVLLSPAPRLGEAG